MIQRSRTLLPQPPKDQLEIDRTGAAPAGPRLRQTPEQPTTLELKSSVDGSRVARAKLTQWHWSGAVFCPAC